jgi:fatty-acyl-CoA synthase
MQNNIVTNSHHTLVEHIDLLENSELGFGFYNTNGAYVKIPFPSLRNKVRARAKALKDLGLSAGETTAIFIPDPQEFLISFLAAVYIGALPVPLWFPNPKAGIEIYAASMGRLLGSILARNIITIPMLAPLYTQLSGQVPCIRRVLSLGQNLIDSSNTEGFSGHKAELDDICFLQCTSGSTSDPKGVCISHRNLAVNAQDFLGALDAKPGKDHGVSWLPLYHNMGLIGFGLGPLMYRIEVSFIPTQLFLEKPLTWLDAIHTHRGTITYAPCSAFGQLARQIPQEMVKKWDLSSLRVTGSGSEPVQHETLFAFADHFAAAGFPKESLTPSYGMGEATLGIAFHRHGTIFKTDRISREEYERNKVAVPTQDSNGYVISSCGPALSQMKIKIVGENNVPKGEREVGEILLQGENITTTYYNNPTLSESMRDGWFATGDLGYFADGELYVSGRIKDLIIISGRNIYPQAIEWQIESLPGVKKNSVASFAVKKGDTEGIVVVCEAHDEMPPSQWKLKVAEIVYQSVNVYPENVVIVREGDLPKTASLKVQRARTKTIYEANQFNSLSS